MRKAFQLIIIGSAFIIMCGMACAPKNKLSGFKWMLGKWKMEANEVYYVEEWKQINDSTFQSSGYQYPAADTAKKTIIESVQLISKGGDVFYVPVVVGQNKGKPVYFKFIGIENEEYKFENKAHDFPQRIIYKPVSKNELYARVEGVMNNQFGALEFAYLRVGK